MRKKRKIGIVRALLRANSSPMFCALLPQVRLYSPIIVQLTNARNQEEKEDENGFTEPPGFHLITYPFADDLRAAPIEEAIRGALTNHVCDGIH